MLSLFSINLLLAYGNYLNLKANRLTGNTGIDLFSNQIFLPN